MTASFRAFMKSGVKCSDNGKCDDNEAVVAAAMSMIVLDEYHCVTQWGHNLRTAYLSLSRVLCGAEEKMRGVSKMVVKNGDESDEDREEEQDGEDKQKEEQGKKKEEEEKKKTDNNQHKVLSLTLFRKTLHRFKVPVISLTATATVDTVANICCTLNIYRDSGVVSVDSRRESMSLKLSVTEHGVGSKASQLIR